MLITSERVDGTKAAEWGLAHEVVSSEADLDDAVERWVQRLLSLPSMSVQMSKYQMRGYSQMSRMGDLSEFDGDASERASRTSDAQARFGTFG